MTTQNSHATESQTMEPSEASFTKVPAIIRVATTILSMVTLAIIVLYFTRRVQNIKSWRKVSATGYLILAIYIDSAVFIMSTAALSKSFSLDHSQHMCDSAMVLCLMFWFTTKILIYFFFVEKAHIVGKPWSSRKADKLYLFNFFGVMGPYVVLFVLCLVYRFAHIDSEGRCIIGVQRQLVYPVIVAELLLNIYLTALFLIPLRKLDSVKNGSATGNSSLRVIALRTFVGSCATLAITTTNIALLGALDGERGWMCLMICNFDILVSSSVLHWATSVDKQGEMSTADGKSGTRLSSRNGLSSRFSAKRQPIECPDDLPDFNLPPDLTADSPDDTKMHGPVVQCDAILRVSALGITGIDKKAAVREQVLELHADDTVTEKRRQFQRRKSSVQLHTDNASAASSLRRPSIMRIDSDLQVPPSALRRPSIQFPETSQDFQIASSKRRPSLLFQEPLTAPTSRRPSAVTFQISEEEPTIPQPRRPSAVTFQLNDCEQEATSQLPPLPSIFQFDQTIWTAPRRPSAVHMDLDPRAAAP